MRLSPGSLQRFLARRWLRAQMRGVDFSVVSNNCWGAHIYQQLHRPYATPFIGLFIPPDCYIRLLENLRVNLAAPLTFKAVSKYESVNEWIRAGKLSYPIGSLADDIEIHFQHYASPNEALAKWSRRLERLAPDDDGLLVKFCDRDGCTAELWQKFDALSFRKKVGFTARAHPELKSIVQIPGCSAATVPDGLQLSRFSYKYFDAAACIRTGDGTSSPRWLRCM